MRDWNDEFKIKLLESPNYREFMRLFFINRSNSEKPKRISFAEFARRCNFASKSYVNDIVLGRKKLTPNSFEKVAQGLKLNSTWTEYFKILVALQESDFQSPKKNSEYFRERHKKIKMQIQRSLSTCQISENESKYQRILLSPDFPEVYASLGELGEGAPWSVILKRSGLPQEHLKKVLEDFESIGLLKIDTMTAHYVPSFVAIESYGLQATEIFRRDFFASLEKSRTRFHKQAKSTDSLFMTQTFSVKSQDLCGFKMQLAELIENFSAQAESPEGDCLAEVCLSFTNNRL